MTSSPVSPTIPLTSSSSSNAPSATPSLASPTKVPASSSPDPVNVLKNSSSLLFALSSVPTLPTPSRCAQNLLLPPSSPLASSPPLPKPSSPPPILPPSAPSSSPSPSSL